MRRNRPGRFVTGPDGAESDLAVKGLAGRSPATFGGLGVPHRVLAHPLAVGGAARRSVSNLGSQTKCWR